MRTNHLGIAALSALVCVLAWTVISKPSSVPSQPSRTVVTTGIRWDRQPADCEGDCLKGYRWGISHEVTESKDCRTLSASAHRGCLLVVVEVERFNRLDHSAHLVE